MLYSNIDWAFFLNPDLLTGALVLFTWGFKKVDLFTKLVANFVKKLFFTDEKLKKDKIKKGVDKYTLLSEQNKTIHFLGGL